MIKKLTSSFSFLNAMLFVIAFLIFSNQLRAQSQKNYSLLWEITGNGLTKPSYIFGSINLKDRRAFNFSDSVFIAIANSSAFALENHPDTISKYLSGSPKSAVQTSEPNPLKIDLKGANETFASYFLYGTARTLKKNFYGLGGLLDENEPAEMEDEEAEEAQKEAMEMLMSLYAKGNLNDIYDELQQYYEDDDFDERNIKITNSIIDIIKNETLFASVVVALLPGENGILAKLKKAGYQLRNVNANFTDIPNLYAIDFEKMNWHTYQDKAYNFSVKFPSNPVINSSGQTKLIFYQDPVNYVGYTAASLYTGPLINRTSEQYIDTVFARYKTNGNAKIISVNKYQKFGSTVLETSLESKGKFLKAKFIHVNGTFYSFTVESENDITNEPFSNLFLNSVEINKPTDISANDWVDYKNLAGGFTIKLPVNPQEVKQQIDNPNFPDNPYLMNIYQATDKTALINYIVRYSDFPNGMYLADKTLVLNALLKDFETKGEIVVKPKIIVENGMEGRSLDVIISQSYMQIKLFIKGNRTYLIIKQNMNGPIKPKENDFFNTFKVKQDFDYKTTPFVIGNFTVNMPNTPTLVPKSKEEIEEQKNGESFFYDEQSYFTFNKNTGGVYGIEKSTISKYYRHSNADTLLYSIANKLSNKGKITELTLNSYKALEFITTDSLAGTTKKSRIWFEGNNCYLQILIADKEEIESPAAVAYFNAAKLNKPEPLFNFQASKAKLIIDDLTGLQQPTYKLALGAISFYNFEKNELPHIYTALKQKYTDDTTSVGARFKLLNEVEKLNDKQTIPLLKQLYQESKNLDLIQSKILSVVPYIDAKSYDWYLKTLTETPVFNIENKWDLFNPLTDSLAFAASNFEKILTLGKEKAYRPMVLNIISTMINSENKSSYLSDIEANADYIKKYAIDDLEDDIRLIDQSKYPQTVNHYLTILPSLNLPSLTDDFTKKVIYLESAPYIKTNAIVVRILKDLPIDQTLVNSQLDSLSSRYTLMRAFNDAGKISSVPTKYREHSEFAKLLLSDFLAEEYDYPLSISLLGNIKEDAKTYYVFEFDYLEENKKKTYIGIAGPFDEEKNTLKFGSYGAYSNFDLKEKDWMKQAKLLLGNTKE